MPSWTEPGLHQHLVSSAIGLSPDEAGGVAGRVSVPEPVVKAVLADLGVTVPRGRTLTAPGAEPEGDLTGPLVLKAWGPGLLHKSDVGAVRLGVQPDQLAAATTAMQESLTTQGIEPAGFLVEEQHPGGTELIVGVVRDATFGHVILLGLGGVATELLGLHSLRVAPLTDADARS